MFPNTKPSLYCDDALIDIVIININEVNNDIMPLYLAISKLIFILSMLSYLCCVIILSDDFVNSCIFTFKGLDHNPLTPITPYNNTPIFNMSIKFSNWLELSSLIKITGIKYKMRAIIYVIVGNTLRPPECITDVKYTK